MDTLVAVFVVLSLFCGLVILAQMIGSVATIVGGIWNNGWKRNLKIFLACASISGVLTGVVYFMPWWGWLVMLFLLLPFSAALAATTTTTTDRLSEHEQYYLRPGFYGKVFDPPIQRNKED